MARCNTTIVGLLQLFNIIQHCMVGNHPAIKPQINRLLNIYEQTYKNSIYSEKLKFEPISSDS